MKVDHIMRVNGKQCRLQVRYVSEDRAWRAVLVDDNDKVIDQSEPGDEVQAERHMETFKRYQAWKPS